VTPIGQASQMGSAKIRKFTASGTYVPTAGMQYCVVELVGGGGGGGGVSGTATTSYGGGGGGAGCYAKSILTAVQVGASQAITIGTGGAGGVGAAAGGNGTTTSFGSLVTASGGLGGNPGYASINPGAGVGGITGTGDVVVPGAPGISGWYGQVTTLIGTGGAGGSSLLGGGGQGANVNNSTAAAGNAGNGPGGGGSGAVCQAIASTQNGGAGANGCVIITEYGSWTSPTAVVRGLLHGLTLSKAGSSTTFTVAPGQASDSTFVDMITLTSAMNKTSGGFAPGGGNGALDTGTIATTTWYHVYVIKNQTTGAVDVLVSLSATTPTMPSGFSLFRRIGSMRFDGTGNWRGFVQLGDHFLWTTPNIDYSSAAANAASRQNLTLTVPTGIQVYAEFVLIVTAGASQNVYATSLDQADTAATSAGGGYQSTTTAANDRGGGPVVTRTDTLARIGLRSSGTCSYTIITQGWTDYRGRKY
jgi:hypothetical protein